MGAGETPWPQTPQHPALGACSASPGEHHLWGGQAAGEQHSCYHRIKETSQWLQCHFITVFPAGPVSGCREAELAGAPWAVALANPLPGTFGAKKGRLWVCKPGHRGCGCV